MKGRQLAVYDFATQPASLGDFMAFLQASLTWSAHCGAAEVDLCIVCNPASLKIPQYVHLGSVEGALRAKIFELLPIAQLHPRIRSILIIDHIDRAYEMLEQTGSTYHSWPPLEMIRKGEYHWYESVLLFDRLHRGQPLTPRLRARPPVAQWARDFLEKHRAGRTAVTVNLRMNPGYQAERNMKTDVWRAFFDDAAANHDATFFLLGAVTENFDCFRDSSNIVVTKDWHTTTEQDLALMEHGTVHIGSSSGPSTFALFLGDKPALSVNCTALPYLAWYRGALKLDGRYLRFNFGNPSYRWSVEPETVEFLTEEFRLLMAAANRPS